MKNLKFFALYVALVVLSVAFVGCNSFGEPEDVDPYQQKTTLGYQSPFGGNSASKISLSKTDGVELDQISNFELEIPGSSSLFATGTPSFSGALQNGISYTLWGTGASGVKYNLIVISVDGVSQNVARVQTGSKVSFQIGNAGAATNQYGALTSYQGEYFWIQSKDGLQNITVNLNGIQFTYKSFSGFLVLPVIGTTMNGTDTLKYALGPSGQFQKNGLQFNGIFSAVYANGGIGFKATGTTVTVPNAPGISAKRIDANTAAVKIWRNDKNATQYGYAYGSSVVDKSQVVAFQAFSVTNDTAYVTVNLVPGQTTLHVTAVVMIGNNQNQSAYLQSSFNVSASSSGTGTFGAIQILCLDSTSSNTSFQAGSYVINGMTYFGDHSFNLTSSVTINAKSVSGYGVQKDSVITVAIAPGSVNVAIVRIKWGKKGSIVIPPSGSTAIYGTREKIGADSVTVINLTAAAYKAVRIGMHITSDPLPDQVAWLQANGWSSISQWNWEKQIVSGKVAILDGIAWRGNQRDIKFYFEDSDGEKIPTKRHDETGFVDFDGISFKWTNVVPLTQNNEWRFDDALKMK